MIRPFDTPPAGPALALTRRLEAPPGAIFTAFTDARLLRQWWGPKGFVIDELEFPAKEGASYRVSLHAPDGTRYVHTGVFLKVEPPSELVYTWRWIEGPLDPAETLVELSFRADGACTIVDLRHSRFVSDEQRDAHRGWPDSFERLVAWLREQVPTDPA